MNAVILTLLYAYTATTPTEEQVYNVRPPCEPCFTVFMKLVVQAMSPDLRRQVDTIRAARIAREQATQQQASAQVRVLFPASARGAHGVHFDVQLADPDAQKPVWADSQRR